MRKFQGLLGTALTFSTVRSFIEKDAEMRQVWGWFAVVFLVALGITVLVSRWRLRRSRQSASATVPCESGTPAASASDVTLLTKSDFEKIKAKLMAQVDDHLREMIDNPGEKHQCHVDCLREHGGAEVFEAYRKNLLSSVTVICDHAYSVFLSPSPLHIPDAPDSNGSFPKELQRWLVMGAAIKECRALDIRAAIEVYKPFEQMIQDRDYVLAIVRKNAGDDGTGTGKMDAAEYEGGSGPEIACRLVMRADQDMFESEMWAYAAHCAGDEGVFARCEDAGLMAARTSLEYWGKLVPSEERRVLTEFANEVCNRKSSTIKDFVKWDKKLRELFRTSQDAEVREEAFKMWDALGETWVQALYKDGKVEEAQRLEELRKNFKAKLSKVDQAREYVSSPEFKQRITQDRDYVSSPEFKRRLGIE